MAEATITDCQSELAATAPSGWPWWSRKSPPLGCCNCWGRNSPAPGIRRGCCCFSWCCWSSSGMGCGCCCDAGSWVNPWKKFATLGGRGWCQTGGRTTGLSSFALPQSPDIWKWKRTDVKSNLEKSSLKYMERLLVTGKKRSHYEAKNFHRLLNWTIILCSISSI